MCWRVDRTEAEPGPPATPSPRRAPWPLRPSSPRRPPTADRKVGFDHLRAGDPARAAAALEPWVSLHSDDVEAVAALREALLASGLDGAAVEAIVADAIGGGSEPARVVVEGRRRTKSDALTLAPRVSLVGVLGLGAPLGWGGAYRVTTTGTVDWSNWEIGVGFVFGGPPSLVLRAFGCAS